MILQVILNENCTIVETNKEKIYLLVCIYCKSVCTPTVDTALEHNFVLEFGRDNLSNTSLLLLKQLIF